MSSLNESRRPPADVARHLRREAGFGCCVCGGPIIQYHHIVEWKVEKHFRLEDMMVLCPIHHDQASKGAMPEAEQREAKASPHNVRRGLADGLLKVRQDYCAMHIGSLTLVGEGPFIRIDGEDLLSLYLGEKRLEISLQLYDENDNLLLLIERNEWIAGDPLPWDLEADWQLLILRERHRKISLSLNAKLIPMQVTADLWRSGKLIKLDANGIQISGVLARGVHLAEMALIGAQLEISTKTLSIGSSKGAVILTWPNRRERLWRARDAWRRLKAERGPHLENP